jgi:hypothetical protein
MMHDWTLISINFDWANGTAQIEVKASSGRKQVMAYDVSEIHIPRRFEWGPSKSINATTGPVTLPDGLVGLAIEMQSSDVIELKAKRFQIPAETTQS